MKATVIPETELEAQDRDRDDILFYTLQDVTPVRACSPPLWASPPLHTPPPPQGPRLSPLASPGCQ